MIRRRVAVALSAIIATAVVAGSLGAQTGVLSGVIYDQTNKTGLSGAEVRIKGTALVAVTGRDGRFTIADVPSGTKEIEAIRSGYRPFRLSSVKIAAADTVHVYLALAVMTEEPVPVDAVSVERDVESLKRLVERTTRITSFGEVSANAPMYVIDGVLLEGGTIISELDPNRIERVEVMKGAAAELLYGAGAANGVIRITTKKNPH
jgi:TonB-dependent SusC/RagA subfamily outer membrane receptor